MDAPDPLQYKINGSEESVQASEDAKKKSYERLNKVSHTTLKSSLNTENYFPKKEYTFKSAQEIHMFIAKQCAVSAGNEVHMKELIKKLEDMENNLNHINELNTNDKDTNNNSKLNNWRTSYMNYIEVIKNHIKIYEYINKELFRIKIRNINIINTTLDTNLIKIDFGNNSNNID